MMPHGVWESWVMGQAALPIALSFQLFSCCVPLENPIRLSEGSAPIKL